MDSYASLVEKLRMAMSLTKMEVNQLQSMPPEVLSDLLKKPSDQLSNSLNVLKAGDVLKCDFHLKHLNIRERADTKFLIGQSLLVGDQKSLYGFKKQSRHIKRHF